MKKHKACGKLTEYSLSAQNSCGNNWEPFLPAVFLASNLFPYKDQAESRNTTESVLIHLREKYER